MAEENEKITCPIKGTGEVEVECSSNCAWRTQADMPSRSVCAIRVIAQRLKKSPFNR